MEKKNIPFGNENEKNTADTEKTILEPALENGEKKPEEEVVANSPESRENMVTDVNTDKQKSAVEDTSLDQEENTAQANPQNDPITPSNAKEETATYAYRWNYNAQVEEDKKAKKKAKDHGVRNFAIIMSVAFILSILTLVGVLVIDMSPFQSHSKSRGSLNALFNECYPSYVAISTASELGLGSYGSGIVMTQDGYIATNHHLVKDKENISVILHDGTSVAATYIDGDELNDIAIIKIEKRGLTPAIIGKSANVKVGDQVIAIGTPFSIQYRGTMTSGYISALNRKYASENEAGTEKKIISLLQTDTSINPGNSGGPLFNMNGEVIGIVAMKIAGNKYEGLGFAIPIDGVIDMINDIIKNGKLTISNGGSAIENAALGITGFSVEKDTKYLIVGNHHYTVTTNEDGKEIVNYITSLGSILPLPLDDSEILEQYDITDYSLYTSPATGVLVVSIDEGFDSKKKLQPNDVIISANGLPCEYMEILQALVASSNVGDKFELEIFRNGTTQKLTVELGRAASKE